MNLSAKRRTEPDLLDAPLSSQIIDCIGKDYFHQNVSSLAVSGRLVFLAFMSGAKVSDFNLAEILFKRLTIQGTTLRARDEKYQTHLLGRFENEALDRIREGDIEVKIYKVFDWENVQGAHEMMEANANSGKVSRKRTRLRLGFWIADLSFPSFQTPDRPHYLVACFLCSHCITYLTQFFVERRASTQPLSRATPAYSRFFEKVCDPALIQSEGSISELPEQQNLRPSRRQALSELRDVELLFSASSSSPRLASNSHPSFLANPFSSSRW